MSTHPLVERFRSGDAPEPLKAAAARGALPLPPGDLLHVLFLLRGERALQQDIVRTIGDLPSEPLVEIADDRSTAPAVLDFIVRTCFKRQEIVERVLLNPSATDATLHLVARHGEPSQLEFLLLNQTRLTRAPQLTQAMLDNPKVTLSIRRRLKEIWDLHQAELARQARPAAAEGDSEAGRQEEASAAAEAEPEPVEPEPEPEPPEAEPDAAAPEADPDDMDLDDIAELSGLDEQVRRELEDEGASEETLRLAERLLTMTVADKLQLALKGNREARNLLIRDSSKQIQESVIKSPKITEDEIEKIAAMRSISQDALRLIGANREYTRSYSICHALVKNPRCPQPTAIQLMARLQSRDLKFLLGDKNVPEAVRRQARLVMQKRDQKK